ncbi:MAG: hypothetical protein R3E58_06075 [Phycisphaerae bacterium]
MSGSGAELDEGIDVVELLLAHDKFCQVIFDAREVACPTGLRNLVRIRRLMISLQPIDMAKPPVLGLDITG